MQSPLAVRFQARNNRVGFGRSCKSNLLTMPKLKFRAYRAEFPC